MRPNYFRTVGALEIYFAEWAVTSVKSCPSHSEDELALPPFDGFALSDYPKSMPCVNTGAVLESPVCAHPSPHSARGRHSDSLL